MKVKNMTSNSGREVANQFIISGASIQMPDDTYIGEAFQSYNSIIVLKAYECGNTGNCFRVFLDADTWDYSVTTGKYRNRFLGETKKQTEAKIKNGTYKLAKLNVA